MATKIQLTCLDRYFSSFEASLAPMNFQRKALSNYRFQLRRFGRVLEAENVKPLSLSLIRNSSNDVMALPAGG